MLVTRLFDGIEGEQTSSLVFRSLEELAAMEGCLESGLLHLVQLGHGGGLCRPRKRTEPCYTNYKP